ncbi:MAG: GNAT family N-acetyltransferase [Anaerolineae bacterium]|nr:GNAT family N-acetyltransferase [Anaerolineae bacterium]
MTDMLVKLYNLPPLEPELEEQKTHGIMIRRAIPPEKHFVKEWVSKHFSEFWASEVDVAFGHMPVSCWLAIEGKQLVGFTCYDTSSKGFFGPIGVWDAGRGRNTGRALLIQCLYAMSYQGYGYAIIGGVGPIEFYQKVVGATIIEDSTPGVYNGMLRQA